MRVKRFRNVIIGLLIMFWSGLAVAHDIPTGMKLRVYSDMTFNKLEGEFNGLEVVIAPYSGGQKILWRSGSGRLSAPLLLDAVKEADGWKVIVPESSDFFGEWKLTLEKKTLRAVGPRGLKFNLKEVVR